MPMQLWSAPTVFMTPVHEDIVVLDVRTDRYECLVDAAAWLKPAADGSLAVPDEGVARQLMDAGLASDRPPPSRHALIPARRALAAPTPASRWDVLRAGLVLAAATATFRSLSLDALVRSPGRAPSSPARHDDRRLAELVGAAQAAAPFVPFEGECLQRAHLLRRLLWREGFRPQWIFGVRTWPFGAHCWLQIDDLVVGDTLDRVRFYTPIMAT